MKKKLIVIIISLLAGILIISTICAIVTPIINVNNKEKDNIRFAKEYGSVGEDNNFIYKTSEEIVKILENGTGIIYLGFPECPWCTKYVTYLNEIAKENHMKVSYLNISEDRKNNTEDYQKMVAILRDYLEYDNNGNKRIYVPAVIATSKGEILGFDDETAYDTKGYSTPDEYWENEDLEGLKTKLNSMFEKVKPTYCTSECNE